MSKTFIAEEKLGPEKWQLLKEIVADALEEKSPAARTALVERRCADDARLLGEAESLVREAEALLRDPTDSLEDCAEQATAALWRDEAPRTGWRIGAYEVVRELGRGGMGAVYLAARADGQFEKQVAIKVLKRGTDTEEVLRRFAAERHILARLDHSNIARLLDAGTTDDGLPYFVMEYVSGAPVTRFVREHELSVPERLAIFLRVCSAVEVAHHSHVIHRDLKPSNILVNADGEVKLLDFGIAKLVSPGQDSLEITAAGEERLTPNCASPEQTDGRPVTEASDVYALGTLLYEMLSGQKPHKFSSTHPAREEIVRVIREEEPVPPSTAASNKEIARQLRGDLDAIVAFAMRKEPGLRYHTAADLAADVRRHLAHEPVLARRGTAGYRARSFLVRHRTAAGALAALLLLSAIAFAIWNRWPRQAPEVAAVAPATAKSIAVLPFDNLGDNNNPPSYFADGVQDNILTDLGKVGDLKVISRSGVASYRGKRNVKEIGRELGVANVLEGSVQISGDRVRINAQLIDTRSDTQIWAEHYDRRLEDIFALQNELAQTIVTQLKVKLTSQEKDAIQKQPTQDLQAYDLYLKARSLFEGMGVNPKANWSEAIELAKQAVKLDDKFTRAYCLINQLDLLDYRFGNEHDPELLATAKAAAETALRLEPDSEEARLAIARYYYNGLSDYRKTQEELAKIPASASHTVEYYTLASLVERRMGRWEESIRDGKRAVELDPQNPDLAVNLIQTYSGLRRFDDSNRLADETMSRLNRPAHRVLLVKSEAALAAGDLAAVRAALEKYPDWDSSDYEGARFWLPLLEKNYAAARSAAAKCNQEQRETPSYWQMMALLEKAEGNTEAVGNDYAEAKRTAQAALVKRPGDPGLLGSLAEANAGLGLKDEALRLARRAAESCPPSVDALVGPDCLRVVGEVMTTNGDREGAFEILNEIVGKPFGPTYGDLKLDPVWEPLRDDPRFDKVLSIAALPATIDE